VVAAVSSVGLGRGMAWLDSEGRISGLTPPSTNFLFSNTEGDIGGWALDDVVFYVRNNELIAQIPGATPSQATEVTVVTGVDTRLAACKGAAGVYYVLVGIDADADGTTLYQVNAAGAVVDSAVHVWPDAVDLLAVSCSGSNILLAAGDTSITSCELHSVVYTVSGLNQVASSEMTVVGFNPVNNDPGVGPLRRVVCGFNAAGTLGLTCSVHVLDNDLIATHILSRTLGASPTGSVCHTWLGAEGRSEWSPIAPIVQYNGRPVLPVVWLNGAGTSGAADNRVGTWAVFDLANATGPLATGVSAISCIAAGEPDRSMLTLPSSCWVSADGTVLRFGVLIARAFEVAGSSVGVIQATKARIEIRAQGAAQTRLNSGELFTGGRVHYFDGKEARPLGFLDAPHIIDAREEDATTLPAGDYGYQVLWVQVDGSGRTVRSRPSPILTFTSTGNKDVVIRCTMPWDLNWSGYVSTWLELYATPVDPTDESGHFLVDRIFMAGRYSQAVSLLTYEEYELVHHYETNESAQQLYTDGSVVPDERPPAGDRGVATVGDRVWVASASKVFASKVARENIQTAWNTGGFLEVPIPQVAGSVQALAAMDDKLVVLCSDGIAVVIGSGFDDNAEGAGWSASVISRVGCLGGPRARAEMPQGVAFVGTDGETYLLDRSLQVSCVSRPVRRDGTGTAAQDICYVTGGAALDDETTTNPLLVATADDSLRVLDTEAGQWSKWRTGSTDE
jgi:hypothetical protein